MLILNQIWDQILTEVLSKDVVYQDTMTLRC